jgi:hypothetical protein
MNEGEREVESIMMMLSRYTEERQKECDWRFAGLGLPGKKNTFFSLELTFLS